MRKCANAHTQKYEYRNAKCEKTVVVRISRFAFRIYHLSVRRLIFLTVCLLLTACAAKPLAEITIPFTGESVMEDIEGDPYRFFRYPSVEAAEKDIARVSPDGQRIGGKSIRWGGPVHIYYLRKRIVVYAGSNPRTLAVISQVFGQQVAGDPVEEPSPAGSMPL